LDQRRVERVEAESSGVDLREQVTVGQQHGRKPNVTGVTEIALSFAGG
jgi:hypothetical protein